MNEPNQLNEGWPADPENEDLLQLAGQLHEAAPDLPAEALVRVEESLERELTRAERRQSWRRIVLGGSLAASMLIALFSYAYWPPPAAAPPRAETVPDRVIDRITIAYSEPGVRSDIARPLIALDDYRSLFAD